jgi:hypothetical protein
MLQILLNHHTVNSSLATKYIGCSLGIILTGIELLSRARYYWKSSPFYIFHVPLSIDIGFSSLFFTRGKEFFIHIPTAHCNLSGKRGH